MNKLVACALLGFGLTQVLVGCGDDDDVIEGGSGNGGTASAGKGGSATAGSATGGKATGGTNATAGTGGKAGSSTGGTATAGTTNVGGESVGGEGGGGGVGGEAIGGDGGLGGAGGAGGAGPVEPDPEPQVASTYWLSKLCDAKSIELLMCDNSAAWEQCYSTYKPFLSTVAEGFCEGDDENDPVKTLALMGALDDLAAACPNPTVEQWRCTVEGTPIAKDQACRDADDARRVASMACGL